MWTRMFVVTVITVISLVIAACAPAVPAVEGPSAATVELGAVATGSVETSESASTSEDAGATSATGATAHEVEASSDAGVTANTPVPGQEGGVMPMETVPDQPQGRTDPGVADNNARGRTGSGAGDNDNSAQTPPGTSNGRTQSSTMVVYTDSTYRFSVSYPGDFSFSKLPSTDFAQFIPSPVAAFRLLNPVLAAGDAPELEVPDLDIRVYAVNRNEAIEHWMVANLLLPADGSLKPRPFRIGAADGLELCASTMIAPGCSYYVRSGDWVYQLTPGSLEGEALMQTFVMH